MVAKTVSVLPPYLCLKIKKTSILIYIERKDIYKVQNIFKCNFHISVLTMFFAMSSAWVSAFNLDWNQSEEIGF